MASQMSPQKLIILTLTLISMSFCVGFAQDDDALINKLCGATYAPTVCVSCVKGPSRVSDPITTDVIVLADMLSCADHDITMLQIDINKILDNKTTDDVTKKALYECNPLIATATENCGLVAWDTTHRRWPQAMQRIQFQVTQKLSQCDQVLAEAGITIPPPVFGGMFAVEGDWKMIYQVLQFLTKS